MSGTQKSDLSTALKLAREVRTRAHAPYSSYRVGAVYKDKKSDQLFSGCNVENASYGATVCAERVAFFSAQAQLGKLEPEYLVLVTQGPNLACPCGLCLQVISEFADGSFPIHLATVDKPATIKTLSELLPIRFQSQELRV